MDFFFRDSLDNLPKIGDRERGARGLDAWAERSAKIEDQDLAGLARELLRHPTCRGLLEAIFSNSPFLTHCILSDMGFFIDFLTRGPDAVQAEVLQGVKQDLHAEPDQARLMSGLRRSRQRTALVVALADLTQTWDLNATVEALSDFADAAVSASVAHLLRQADEGAELTLPDPENPEHGCGYTVLALGKLGARELNYSSDIDLIVLFDPQVSPPRAGRSPQEGFVRMTRDLVRILEERTAEGYVFRTDLRLRPDPGAMPLAISTASALTYYESLGQNWERAALIKARPIAGDLRMGDRFLAELRPFIWRKNLDFWAIQDIHSIKRQIYAHKGGAEIAIEGHDIKLGRGGIREIEFFAQTQQLIWGGREPLLRCANTQDALAVLAAADHVSAEATATLGSAYRFLRRLEHRLQMVDDRQTQRLPEDRSEVARIGAFMGYADNDRFRAELLTHLRAVEDHYAALFEEAPALATFGNLVFTGGDPEPGTLKTLTEMGFEDGAMVFNLVRAWHHGRYRATRSTRSRQLLTELMPTLLQALAKTTQPDQALTKFDEFLAGLPAGVQLFSMLYANPTLLDLLAEIMGGAPALADHLSRRAELLEAVLASNFFEPIPAQPELAKQFALAMAQARDFQDALDIARRWANDRRFQVGVHILRHASEVDESGRALSDIADTALAGLYQPVLEDFARVHGQAPGPGMAVLAMGKLGAREMTVASDLDLILIYDTPKDETARGAAPGSAGEALSDGPKPLPISQYFGRLAQRYINALTARTSEGRLYEIDMRLRPSGSAGPIATSLSGWHRYYQRDSWTWEHMALTRARVVTGDPGLAEDIRSAITALLRAPRDPEKLLVDVAEMRARIEGARPAKTIWSVKYLRGGLTDLEFLAQYMLLRHASAHPEILDRSTQEVYGKLAKAGLLAPRKAEALIQATRLMRQVQGMLRLTISPAFDADTGPQSLQASLARAAGMADFAALRSTLVATAETTHRIFVEMIEAPARAAGAKLDPPDGGSV